MNTGAQTLDKQDEGPACPYTAIFSNMTAKQHEVFAYLAENRTSKEIAARLGVSESAVVQRIEAVRCRAGFVPRAELARAYRQYLVSFDDEINAADLDAEKPISGEFMTLWQRHAADWVLPGALVGANAGLNRLAAMVVIAAGLLVIALCALSVVWALATLPWI